MLLTDFDMTVNWNPDRVKYTGLNYMKSLQTLSVSIEYEIKEPINFYDPKDAKKLADRIADTVYNQLLANWPIKQEV